MNSNVRPLYHLPDRPEPRPRSTGVASLLRAAMSTTRDITKMNMPVLKVVGAISAAAILGWWGRGLTMTVENTAADVAEIRQSLNAAVVRQDEEIRSLERNLREVKTDLRLLQDFTEGRVGDMPYRSARGDDP